MEVFGFYFEDAEEKKCFRKSKSTTVWRSDLRRKLEGDETTNPTHEHMREKEVAQW